MHTQLSELITSFPENSWVPTHLSAQYYNLSTVIWGYIELLYSIVGVWKASDGQIWNINLQRPDYVIWYNALTFTSEQKMAPQSGQMIDFKLNRFIIELYL